MKTLFYLSRKRINKKGLAPIYCRLSINGRRSEISSGFFISPSEWKLGKGLKENSHELVMINSNLSKMKSDLTTIYSDLRQKGKVISSQAIKRIYTGQDSANLTFLQLVEAYTDDKLEDLKVQSTIKSLKARKAQITEYIHTIRRTGMMPEELDRLQAKQFHQYLLNKKNFKRNYANKIFQVLRGVLEHGVTLKLIPYNPLAAVRLKHDKRKKVVHLSAEQLTQIMAYNFASSKIQQVADCFIFQCFTGLAYCDLAAFNYLQHVVSVDGEEWIIQSRGKSDVEATLPLFAKAKQILQKYDYKLPVVSLQRYNDYLKEVSAIVGFPFELTSHIARKTFGMLKLNKDGFSLEAVQKMLGHLSIKTTEKDYSQVNIERIKTERQQLRIR